MDTTNEGPGAGNVHRHVAVIVTAALLAASGLTALVMRFSQVRPVGLLGLKAFSHVFTAHAVLLFALFPALLLSLARLRRQARAPTSGVVHASAWVAWGAIALVVLAASVRWQAVIDLDGKNSVTAGAFLLAPVLAAVHLTLELWKSERTPGLVVIVLVAWSLVVGVGATWVASSTTGSLTSILLAIAALGALHDELIPENRWRDRVGFMALYAAVGLPTLGDLGRGLGVFIALPLGIWLSVRVLRASLGRMARGATAFAALSAFTFAEALVGELFLRSLSMDTHLHDTLVSVAVYHLGILTALFAFVALSYARSHGADGGGRTAVLVATTAFAGSQLFHFGFFVAGMRGMPRRYMNYLQEFQTLHVLATIGSVLLVAGLAGGLFDALTRREPVEQG